MSFLAALESIFETVLIEKRQQGQVALCYQEGQLVAECPLASDHE